MRKLLLILSLISTFAAGGQEPIYKLRLTTGVRDYAADGVGCEVLNDTIHFYGGWNPDYNPVSGADSLHFISADSGKHWTKLPDMPVVRHDFIHFVKNSKMYLVAGDGFNDSRYYTTASGWVTVSSSMTGFGPRNKPMWCYNSDDGYVYAAGGTGNDGHAFRTLIRSSDFITWDSVAQLPTELWGCNKGAMSYLNGNYYIMGGYLYGDSVTGDVWKVTANTYTFTKIISDSSMFQTYYCNSAVAGGRIWFLRGRDIDNNNAQGLYWSTDGQHWTRFTYQLSPGRHATGMCAWGENVVFACGNLFNQFWLLKRIDN